MVSFGIWAVGPFVFTLLIKVAIPVEKGDSATLLTWNASLDVKKKTRAGNKVHSENFRFPSKIQDFSAKNT